LSSGRNLPIAVRASEQVVPKVAGTSDGGCFVGWYDLSFGQYSICLQRLDRDGNELWPHNGILVSGHPQLSYVTDWDLIADTEDHAVLVVSDARDGEDLDPHAYRVDGEGNPLWGPNGITLSANADYEPAPVVAQASDGDFVFAWSRFPDAGSGAIQMQRISPAGVVRFPAGGLPVVAVPNEDPAFPRLVPSTDGGVILVWVRDVSQYMSPRHVRAQRFSAAGAAVWPAVVNVYDAGSVPMGYGPDACSNTHGGALVLWHSAPVDMFNSRVQDLTAGGIEVFPHNGVTVSTVGTRHHIDPALAYHADDGEIFVFWNERNPNQTQWGIYGQKLTATGTRAWGDAGIAFVPVNGVFKSTQRAAPCGDGALAFYLEANGSIVRGFRVDNAGNQVWPGAPIAVSNAGGTKSRLPIVQDHREVVVLIWEDGRNDFADVYGQNVNPDGTLGPAPASVVDGTRGLRLAQNEPNPFSTATRFTLGPGAAGAVVCVCDATGRTVRTLAAGGAASVRWDGTDDRGRPLPGGVYFYRLEGAAAVRRAVLVR
jgi:hypothetical protein